MKLATYTLDGQTRTGIIVGDLIVVQQGEGVERLGDDTARHPAGPERHAYGEAWAGFRRLHVIAYGVPSPPTSLRPTFRPVHILAIIGRIQRHIAMTFRLTKS